MEPSTSASPPKPRWYRRRKLQLLLVLLAGCVAAFFAWDALFMPAELGRMQGSWRFVRINGKTDPKDDPEIGTSIRIIGRQIIVPFARGPCLIEVKGDRIILCDPADTERTFLGCKLRLPTWLCLPKEYVFGKVACNDRELIIHLQGEVRAGQPIVEEPNGGEKWNLERE